MAECDNRDAGYYWVKLRETTRNRHVDWTVAYWCPSNHGGGWWDLPGGDCGADDSDMVEIRQGRLEPPTD